LPHVAESAPRTPSGGTAALAVAVSAIGFGAMVVLAKAAAHRLPGPEVAWIRFCIGLASCLVAHVFWPMRPTNVRGLLLRGTLGGAAVLCFFLSVEHLPVGVATLLNYTAPLWASLWAFLFLRERVPRLTFAAMAVAFFGVALVLRGESSSLSLGSGGWELVGVLSGVLSGASVATIRELRRTDGSWEIFLAFNLGGLVVCGPSTWAGFLRPTPHEWLLLVAVGLLSVAAQLGLTWALRYSTAAGSGVLMQLTPVTAFLGGALAFGDRIPAASLAGAGLALSGVAWGAWLASRRVVIEEDV
jgi:drug/metabolite transporter (DMT)-like permease